MARCRAPRPPPHFSPGRRARRVPPRGRAVRLRGSVRQVDRVGPGGDRARPHRGRGDRARVRRALPQGRAAAAALGHGAQRRDPRRALGRVLRGDQGVDRRHRPAGLRELSVVRAAGSSARCWACRSPRGKLGGAALVALGLVLLVPEFTWESHTVRGLAWGVLSGFTFALHDRAHAQARARALVLGDGALAKRDRRAVRAADRRSGRAAWAVRSTAQHVRQDRCCSASSARRSRTRCTPRASRACPRRPWPCARRWSRCTASRSRSGLLGEVPDGRTIAGATLLVSRRHRRVAPDARSRRAA